MIDPKEFGAVLKEHFHSVTTEEFLQRVDKVAPGLFEATTPSYTEQGIKGGTATIIGRRDGSATATATPATVVAVQMATPSSDDGGVVGKWNRLTDEEADAFYEAVAVDPSIPVLSDEAMDRDSIYGEG